MDIRQQLLRTPELALQKILTDDESFRSRARDVMNTLGDSQVIQRLKKLEGDSLRLYGKVASQAAFSAFENDVRAGQAGMGPSLDVATSVLYAQEYLGKDEPWTLYVFAIEQYLCGRQKDVGSVAARLSKDDVYLPRIRQLLFPLEAGKSPDYGRDILSR